MFNYIENLNDDQGVRYGALSMDLDLAAMSLPLKEIALPLNGKLAVVHHSGQIVMHANPQEITLPIAHPEWLKQMTDAEGYFMMKTQAFMFITIRLPTLIGILFSPSRRIKSRL